MGRARLSFDDLAGRAVGIYGLGVEGRASLRACVDRGITPIVVDDAPDRAESDAPDGSLGLEVLCTDRGGLDALTRCDVVIKSPGISRYGEAVHALESAGCVVVGGLGLWLAAAPLERVLAITGTKGKSTTTAIAGHLLDRFGFRVLIGGNIGRPPFDPDIGDDVDYWVVEVSSYQATDLPVSPPVTAVTSLDPDHLPWHAGDVETYYRDKLSMTSQPGAAVTVANGDSVALRERRALLGPRVEWVHADAGDESAWTAELGLAGRHNRRNALIAARALDLMGVRQAADAGELAAAARGFAGLPSRLQTVGIRGGVTFVDDNLSTNVLPTLAALEAFGTRRVALLVGGQSRGIDYAPLADGLAARTASCLVVTMPGNGPDIHRRLAEVGTGPAVSIVDAESLDDAVRLAADWADPDGVVLLSPAAPSFDRFRNYRERGAAFARAMRAVGGVSSPAAAPSPSGP